MLSEAIAHSKYSLRDLGEAIAREDAVLYAEASIQSLIFSDEKALNEKYSKLAREIGAKPPWELLTERGHAKATPAKR
jgi:hypothetical protein